MVVSVRTRMGVATLKARGKPMRRSDFSFANLGFLKICAIASAVILTGIVLPLAGGLPKGYELREFAASMGAFMNGEASTRPADPALYPHHHERAPGPSAKLEVRPVERQANARAREEEEASLVQAAQVDPLAGPISDADGSAVGAEVEPAPQPPTDGETEVAPEPVAVSG
jgi:hypothetical protein